jgi:crotonobetainyl-CoA:carnitine CoA-transferase CaiB-like acyl-CoA transferase
MTLPLEGLRVLEYAQYVAGPFAGMLLADLGADVVKVEPPTGDAWRHYEPFAAGESRYFYALNRNKRSVVLDLKTDAGLRASRALLADADAVLHNFPPDRAARYGLDRESVRSVNPRAAWCTVSALGSDGPEAELTAFDLVAQALSGLLLADARPGDEIPRRAGGIAIADFTAGLLAAISVLAGLVGRREAAPGVEVSLLGAALAVQAQRFVSVDGDGRGARPAGADPATAHDLAAHGARVRASEELEPYYRAYRAADGFFVLTCLNEAQRRATLRLLGLDDPFVADPQAPPASDAERAVRVQLVRRVEAILAREPARHWVGRLRAAGVPAAQVRTLEQLYEDPQAVANGLVQDVAAPGGDTVRLLGGVFKVDGAPAGARRGVPALGEHTDEVLEALPSEAVTSAARRADMSAGADGREAV